MDCCGSPRETNFCPDCGNKIRQLTDLERLAMHCIATRNRAITKGQEDAKNKWTAYVTAIVGVVKLPLAPEIKAALESDAPLFEDVDGAPEA